MNSPVLYPWVGAIPALLILAGCGAGSDSEAGSDATPAPPAAAAAGPTDRACELLPKAEAEQILGGPIEDVSDESNPQQMGAFTRSSCFYRGSGGSVQLIVHTFADPATAESRFDGLRKRYSGNDAQDVAVGQKGFGYHEELVVLAGRRHLMVKLLREGSGKITSYSDAAAMGRLWAEERPIAEKAIGRLPPA